LTMCPFTKGTIRKEIYKVPKESPKSETVMAMFQITQIRVPEGQTLEIQDVSWSELEDILQDLGEQRNTRIAYSKGTLSIMAPLPEHEVSKVCIGDFVKIVLDELDQDYVSLGSTTFKNESMLKAIEPDDCFYIQNYQQVLGKSRLDLSVDPPPELAIEIEVTSKTQLDAYEGLGVVELWRYDAGKLRMDRLQKGGQESGYVEVESSPTFPSWLTKSVIEKAVARAQIVGQGKARKEFRQWVVNQIMGDQRVGDQSLS
jgi:Uma2 family endonuclease